MRKLLQSKAFVGALVAGAALTFVWPKLKSGVATPSMGPATALVAPIAPLTSATASTALPGNPWRSALTNWHQRFPVSNLRRDPFIQVRTVAIPAPTNYIPPIEPTLVLQAISVHPQRNLAVINRTVLGEGDRVEGYRVESIHPTEVRLKQGERDRILRFELAKQPPPRPAVLPAPIASSEKSIAAPVTAQTLSSPPIR
jgi:hypothetical protein